MENFREILKRFTSVHALSFWRSAATFMGQLSSQSKIPPDTEIQTWLLRVCEFLRSVNAVRLTVCPVQSECVHNDVIER